MSCVQEPQAKGAKSIMAVFLHSKGMPDMQLLGQFLHCNAHWHMSALLEVELPPWLFCRGKQPEGSQGGCGCCAWHLGTLEHP